MGNMVWILMLLVGLWSLVATIWAWRERKQCQIAKHESHQLDKALTEARLKLEASVALEQKANAWQELAQIHFKNIANDILDEKTKKFAGHNQASLGQILTPFKDEIKAFKEKFNAVYEHDIKQQATLGNELKNLKELNLSMTKEAHDLTTALKGQSKTQGAWGEMMLGNILDRSGLREGKDFKREKNFHTEEGRRRPDVIVYLPNNKHLIIDAKVSLNAYTRYVNADSDIERAQALQEHINAVTHRIKELSDRQYFKLDGLNSPEVVFMFIPIESAFVEALRANDALFQKAIEEQHVLVATPTTLLTSLNIVRQLWRFEEQNAHSRELAEHASKFYHKLVGFLDSMEDVGRQLDKSKQVFSQAMGQFYTGKGNLIKQAESFQKLGVSVQKKISDKLVDKASLELDYFPIIDSDVTDDEKL